MNKRQGIAYATLTLDLLYKMKIKITPEIFAEQMKIVYDLYDLDEVEKEFDNMLENNKIIYKNLKGRANCYIINIFDSTNAQKKAIEKYCGKNIEIGKIYVTPPGENQEKYYELIRDIRNKNMDILFMTIFTIIGMSDIERAVIVKLCRQNDIILVEI